LIHSRYTPQDSSKDRKTRGAGLGELPCRAPSDDDAGPTLSTGDRDIELDDRLTEELVAFYTAATGAAATV
jgi:hypothetical protein